MNGGNRHAKKPRRSSSLRLSPALEELLTQLAAAFLANGVTPKTFGELIRRAYVRAAADTSKLQNGKVNQSRIAVCTGLSRAEVKRILNIPSSDLPSGDLTPLHKVVNGWRTDRRFVDKRGKPKRLRISGPGGSFVRLVKTYGGDVPHRAVLDELRRIGAVIDAEGSIVLRTRDPRVKQRLFRVV